VDGHPGRRQGQLLDRLGAATALIFGAAYTLWMFKRVYLGAVANDDVKGLQDINAREFLTLRCWRSPCSPWASIPKPFTDVMDSSVAELLKHVALVQVELRRDTIND
jgi:NADH-quinone oxidoreductase subunit M